MKTPATTTPNTTTPNTTTPMFTQGFDSNELPTEVPAWAVMLTLATLAAVWAVTTLGIDATVPRPDPNATAPFLITPDS